MPDAEIRTIQSDLTVMGGQIVHGSGPFSSLGPSLPKASPDWSPVAVYGGWGAPGPLACSCSGSGEAVHSQVHAFGLQKTSRPLGFDLWGGGCACWSL